MSEGNYCSLHMQDRPCEMCKPTRCLTHRRLLPCVRCQEVDETGQQALRSIGATVDKADMDLALQEIKASVCALQAQLTAMQAQLTALEEKVKCGF